VEVSGPFGRYVLKERLARGGMGEVFRAVAIGEHGFEKPVVVKRVLPAHAGREDLTELFVAEAKLMTRLAHPNIVEVYDFGRGEHKDYYLVLELVDGVDLGRLLRAFAARGEPFPVPLALFIAAQVLRGLHHAHTRLADEGVSVIHRDVSPSNVLLSTEGEVKVADFGVALVQRELRPGGGVAGKPGYMAPEQFEGRAVDARADVFSAGVVLHQMLAGRPPFAGDTPEAQQEAAARGDRAPLAGVAEPIEAIVARALSPSADARFPTARAMAQAIEALRDGGQRLASADDLADAVRAAKRELPVEARRVIALSGAASAERDDDAPRELTRAGGAFTLRFPVRADATTRQVEEPLTQGGGHTLDRYAAPEPRTEALAPEERAAPIAEPDRAAVIEEVVPPRNEGRPRVLRNAALVVLLAAAGLAIFIFSVRTPAPVPSHAPAASAPALPPVASAPPPVASSVPAAEPEPSGVAPAPPKASAIPARVPIARPPVSAPAPPATVSAAPPREDDCTGKVHFSSDDSWDVSGGPSPAQTPGIVTWRCGNYSLTARYRPDPSQTRSVSVQVRPDRQAEVSFWLR
jgi:serine/threonine-protein kinase